MRAPWRRRDATGLIGAARREYLTPRRDFGPSDTLDRSLARTTEDVYLRLAPHLAEGEPVHAVGWARNDFWAVRIWSTLGNDFRNDEDPDAAGAAMPDLKALGWPRPLAYAATLAAAKERAKAPVMVTAGYRLGDGGFQSHAIHADPRTKFHFEQANPEPADVAVAIELGLAGPRWIAHLAEIKAINDENRRRGIV